MTALLKEQLSEEFIVVPSLQVMINYGPSLFFPKISLSDNLMLKNFVFFLFLTGIFIGGSASSAVALENEPFKTNQVISKQGYKAMFPKACPVSKGKQGYISLCAALFQSQKVKPLPAVLPLFMVFGESLSKQKNRTFSKTDIKRDAARLICGSEQELSAMIVEQQSFDKSDMGAEQKLTVICPADKYGVIDQRKGAYLQVTTSTHRYHVLARFLLSQSNSLSSVAQSFIDSFQLSLPNQHSHLKDQ